ncbi:hypothetical protein BHM03_00046694 [Ensete ventricosum]|nr:hypothetical protein BHM03_00046694 [Ensete ventricosum]
MALGVWSPSLIDVVLFVIAAVVVWKLERRRRRGWATGRLPPGSEGLPVVGETLQLIAAYKSENPEPFIDERVRRHGRLFTTHVFGERTVFSADPEFNRMVLGAEDRTVEGSYPSSLSTLLGTHSLVVMKGARHKRMHSLTLARLTSPTAIREAKLLLHIDRLVRRTLDSWASSSLVLLLDEAKKITFELTVKQLVSYDQRKWIESLRREYLLLINGFFSIPFPSFLSFTTYGRALKARRKVEEALKEVIRKRKLEKATTRFDVDVNESQNNKKKKDMLEELLEGEAEGMTDEAVVDFLLSLLVAGYETTSTIMTLAVKFLTDHPRALAQLREEQEGIRKKKKDEEAALDWDEYKSMPFTQCVINETLRVVNIIGGVFRRAKTELHFKGYTIPMGCKVFLSFRAVHLDNEYFDDARTFDPWRWQVGGPTVYTPFGGGSRLCPGYELARVVISVFLHYLVTRFNWEEAEKDRLVFFPTTRTLKSYPINVRRREEEEGA